MSAPSQAQAAQVPRRAAIGTFERYLTLCIVGLTQHSRREVQSSAGCLAGSSLHAHMARDRDGQTCLDWL